MAKRTVYVIGAGASFEAGLPTGQELKMDIARRLNLNHYERDRAIRGESNIYQALKAATHGGKNGLFHSYISECQHISENMPLAISIDNFLDSERDNDKLALCGKLAIISSILSAERGSKFYFDRVSSRKKLSFSELEGTWYLPFFRTLTEGCNAEEVKAILGSITLIIFNYDRCIEHFLMQAFMSYYRLSEDAAAELIECLEIIHPYGKVGSLIWQDDSKDTSVEFGFDVLESKLIGHAKEIRTFTEGTSGIYKNKITAAMEKAGRLIFLGFACHPLNMELLSRVGFEDGYMYESRIDCFVTSLGSSKSDQESIMRAIQHMYQAVINFNVEDLTCAQLFQHYSRSLGYY